MKSANIIALACGLAMVAQAHAASPEAGRPALQSEPPAGAHARIRINKDKLMIRVFEGCYPKWADSIYQYSPSQYRSTKDVLLWRKPIVSVGMPMAKPAPKFYGEYYASTAAPLVVGSGDHSEVTSSYAKTKSKLTCGPVFVAFDPQAGKDYEIGFARRGMCTVDVTELTVGADGGVVRVPVTTSPVPAPCR